MSTDGDSITTPLVRGLIAALSVLGIGLAVVVVPALAAQVAQVIANGFSSTSRACEGSGVPATRAGGSSSSSSRTV